MTRSLSLYIVQGALFGVRAPVPIKANRTLHTLVMAMMYRLNAIFPLDRVVGELDILLETAGVTEPRSGYIRFVDGSNYSFGGLYETPAG